MHRFVRAAALSAVVALALICTSCGDSQPTEADASGDKAAPAASAHKAGGPLVPDCSLFPKELLDKYGLQKQLVLNFAMAQGRNLKTMRETMGAPEPATFRRLASAFESFDPDGIKPVANFDAADVIARDLRKTADLLEHALAAGDNTADPAWAALSAFYTQTFFVHHNASISYYLSNAGCM